MIYWMSRATRENLLYISYVFGRREIELVKTSVRLKLALQEIGNLNERVAKLEQAAQGDKT